MNRFAAAVPFAIASVAFAPATFAADAAKSVQVAQAADKKAAPAKPAAEKAKPETRNWAAIDSNKDGLISPEEMEAYLKANPGPLAPK